MKIEKLFVFKKMPQHLAETFGKEKATAIMQYANTELQALEASEPDAEAVSKDNSSSRHSDSHVEEHGQDCR